jgi:hypothetical protein
MSVLAYPNGTKNDSTPRENAWTKPAAMAIRKEPWSLSPPNTWLPV